MKRSTILLLCVLNILSIEAKPILEGDEIDSHEAAFHHAIHDSAEFYLVCVYEVAKKPSNKVWEQLDIKATVVESIKGGKPVGEKINFQRVLDGKYGDVSHMVGSLYFVRYDKVEGASPAEPKTLEINPQDPHAVFGISKDLLRTAKEHKEAEQDASGNRR
jgi:hypothetical protein